MHHVYKVTQLSTGRVYVGVTGDKGIKPRNRRQVHPKRFAEHLAYLSLGVHPNEDLQASYTRPGDYAFEVLESLDTDIPAELTKAERAWIAKFKDPFNIKYAKHWHNPYQIPDGTKAAIQRGLLRGERGCVLASRFCVSTGTVSLLKKPLKTLGLV
jgi:hypothetical protein